MGLDLVALLERARLAAQRRRHEKVDPDHLLFVILDEEIVGHALRLQGLDPEEVRERLEARFTSRPTMGGYRDGLDVPLAPTLERVIERLTERRWLSLDEPMTVLDALMLEPWIASLVVGLRRGDSAEHVLSRAWALAIVRGHLTVELGHVVSVLLDVPIFVEIVERIRGDLPMLRRGTGEALILPTDPDRR
jgi:hypothetical protein